VEWVLLSQIKINIDFFFFFFLQKEKIHALLALLIFSLVFGFGLPARTLVLFFSATDEFVLSSSLAIAAGVESAATFRSESALLFLRRLRLDSAGVSMMLSNCAAASEEPGTDVDGALGAI
jgi:hypothetical protein